MQTQHKKCGETKRRRRNSIAVFLHHWSVIHNDNMHTTSIDIQEYIEQFSFYSNQM